MTAPRQSRLEIEEMGDVTIVHFVDRNVLDEQNIDLIGKQFQRMVDEENRLKI